MANAELTDSTVALELFCEHLGYDLREWETLPAGLAEGSRHCNLLNLAYFKRFSLSVRWLGLKDLIRRDGEIVYVPARMIIILRVGLRQAKIQLTQPRAVASRVLTCN